VRSHPLFNTGVLAISLILNGLRDFLNLGLAFGGYIEASAAKLIPVKQIFVFL
jgi:hypothetical protein